MTEPAIAYAREGGWLLVKLHGEVNVPWLTDAFRVIAERAAHEGPEAVLIDARTLVIEVSDTDRYWMASAIATSWHGGPPAALVGAPGWVDPDRFGELVARNRGTDGGVFLEIEDARAWLRERVAARAAEPDRRPAPPA